VLACKEMHILQLIREDCHKKRLLSDTSMAEWVDFVTYKTKNEGEEW
jgi:hypothetical protein